MAGNQLGKTYSGAAEAAIHLTGWATRPGGKDAAGIDL